MFAASALVVALAAVVANAQDLSVQAPSLTQCTSSAINFSGGSGPYYVAILKGEDPCGNDAIQEFFDVNDSSVSYTPALASGTQVLVYVEDTNGAEAWSDTITIGGGDSSCIGGSDSPSKSTTTQETPAQNTPTSTTEAVPVDTTSVDETTNNSTYDGADTEDPVDTLYESSSAVVSSSSSSSSTSAISTARTTYVAPNNVVESTSTASIETEDSGVTIQNTNANTDTDNQGNTPSNVGSGATGLTVSVFTAFCAVLAVSFGLF